MTGIGLGGRTVLTGPVSAGMSGGLIVMVATGLVVWRLVVCGVKRMVMVLIYGRVFRTGGSAAGITAPGIYLRMSSLLILLPDRTK